LRTPPFLAAIAAAAALVACVSPAPRRAYAEPLGDAATESLFPSDAAVLPDDAIARILAHAWSAPAKARVAVLRVGQRSPYDRWSDEFARLDGQLRDTLLGAFRGSPRISAAGELPSLLVPKDQTVGHLREAAARFRAELLVAWRADCRSYERYRLFGKDESKAHCDVEAVLVDVRTGIVPFSAAASRDFATKQAGDELSVAESSRRAEMQATGEALQEVAQGVLAFLDATPAPRAADARGTAP
jgi:hypothetical protein